MGILEKQQAAAPADVPTGIALALLDKAYVPTVSGIDQNLPGIKTGNEACCVEKSARPRNGIDSKCCVSPDLSMASYAADALVEDFSALERFPSRGRNDLRRPRRGFEEYWHDWRLHLGPAPPNGLLLSRLHRCRS